MNKRLLTLLLLFTCFARAQVVDTWQFANPQQQEQALNIASQLRWPAVPESELTWNLMRRWQSVCAIRFTAWWRRGKVKSKSLAG